MILITGCARSGTSLTARIIAACGANMGHVNVLHENTSIRDGLIKKYLTSIGMDPRGQRRLPALSDLAPKRNWRESVLVRLNVPEPRAYKDAKICLMWPLWAEAFPDARWIIVRRDRDGIVNSCMRTKFMNAYRDAKDWSRWIEHHEQRLREIVASCNAREVWPLPNFVELPEMAKSLTDWCGLEWRSREVLRAIAKKSP